MVQSINFLNENKYRYYPFKYKKVLPIVDLSLEVPAQTTACFVSDIQPSSLILSRVDGEEGGATEYAKYNGDFLLDIPLYLYKIVDVYKLLPDPIGYFILGDIPKYPQTFDLIDSELLESTYYESKTRKIYRKTNNGEYIRIYNTAILKSGTNIEIDGQKIHNITREYIGNYLKAFRINNELTVGNGISIFGANLIHIYGSIFSTSVTDPNRRCTAIFNPNLLGEPGDFGNQGYDGVNGEYGTGPYYPVDYCGNPCPGNPYGAFNSACTEPDEL